MPRQDPDPSRELPVISFASPRAWDRWLAKQHTISLGIWVKVAKKDSGIETVTYSEALDVALSYGWIDGQKAKFDAEYWLQRFTPRTARSKWSKINCARANELVKRGEMKPNGRREMERAKADGRWDAAYEGQRTITVPDDLQRALDSNLEARAFFATLDSRNRYAILFRIEDAKRQETRAQRIEKFVAMLSRQEKIYP